MIDWRKSSYSNTTGECVEVGELGSGLVALRDSKNPGAGHREVARVAFAALVAGIKNA
ncbi:DUF397 domain-containing protein [Actinocorallia aurantiaca]|uniref:DUF397 domain-containing protein n=1 Tax=Actinocorallia aurantiaca TaxID=46204 RepID=A0ABP6GS69_9ACTN